MRVDHPICCGIDVHKDTLTACLRCVAANGHVSQEGRALATISTSLWALSDWLVEQHCPMGAMESTGVYWIPLYDLLESTGFQVLLVDPRQVQRANRAMTLFTSLGLSADCRGLT